MFRGNCLVLLILVSGIRGITRESAPIYTRETHREGGELVTGYGLRIRMKDTQEEINTTSPCACRQICEHKKCTTCSAHYENSEFSCRLSLSPLYSMILELSDLAVTYAHIKKSSYNLESDGMYHRVFPLFHSKAESKQYCNQLTTPGVLLRIRHPETASILREVLPKGGAYLIDLQHDENGVLEWGDGSSYNKDYVNSFLNYVIEDTIPEDNITIHKTANDEMILSNSVKSHVYCLIDPLRQVTFQDDFYPPDFRN